MSLRLHLELRVGAQPLLEWIERRGRGKLDVGGLERIAAVIRGLKHGGVGPDFRFGRAPATRKYADDFPLVLGDFQLIAGQNSTDDALPTDASHKGLLVILSIDQEFCNQSARAQEKEQIKQKSIPVLSRILEELAKSGFTIDGQIVDESTPHA